VLSARGQVTVSTAINVGGGMTGVSAYRSGLAEFRAGLSVTVPAVDDLNNFYPVAIGVSSQGQVRVRNSGTNQVAGQIKVTNDSLLEMNSTSQSAGGILAFMNSTVIINDSSVGPVEAIAESAVQFGSGIITVGTDGETSILCELASSIVVGDLNGVPTFSTSAGVELVENCYLGMFNGTITGDITAEVNSTLTLEAYSNEEGSVAVTGNIRIDNNSSALFDGDDVTIGGNVDVARSSTMSLRSGASVDGYVRIRASSGIDIQGEIPGDIVGVIGGELECDSFTGNYMDIFPENTNVAASYRSDGSLVRTEFTFVCGWNGWPFTP
jgi:hypothetical protein